MTMEELIAETICPWKHLPLKQRAIGLDCHAKDFHFDGQLHIMRMLEMMGAKRSTSTAAGWRRYICSLPVRSSGRRPSPQSGRIRSILPASGLVTVRCRNTSYTGVNANRKMSFFAGMECHLLAVSMRWVCSLDYPLLVGLKPVKS